MSDSKRGAKTHDRPAALDSAGQQDAAGSRFAFLDALRGIGAIGITCYHVHRYRPLEIPADHFLPKTVQFVVSYGWISVQVFWVIAGFVLAYSLRKTLLGPTSFGNFSLRRVLRLGSPYWVAILFVVAIDFFARQWLQIDPRDSLVDDAPISWAKLGANLAFLQDVLQYGNISAGTWFVCVDLQCGLLFAAMLWIVQSLSRPLVTKSYHAKFEAFVLTLVFVPLGLAALFRFNIDSDDYSAWVIYFFHMPLLGAMAWWALEGRIPRAVFWGFVAAMVGGIVYRFHLGLDHKKPLDVGVATTAGVVIYLVGRWGHLGDWLSWRPLQYLGRISYSLFLIHYATSWIVVSIGCRLTPDSPAAAVLWMSTGVAASIVAAHFLYLYVEAPSLRLVKRIRST